MGQGESLGTSADPLVQRQGFRRPTGDGKPRQAARVFPFHNRVSRKEAFAGPEPDAGKLSRPVLRGPAPSNGGWLLGGAPRIHSEVLMLGFDVSERTISRWMKRAPRDGEPGRRWLTFLRNHREAIAAMDFSTVPTATFGVLYCFFVIGHDRRRILHFNVARHLTSAWTIQQLREAFPFESAHRFLIFDRDTSCPITKDGSLAYVFRKSLAKRRCRALG